MPTVHHTQGKGSGHGEGKGKGTGTGKGKGKAQTPGTGQTGGPATQARIHHLDVGDADYGDCILADFGGVRVLIDGAHPGNDQATGDHAAIQDQIGQLLGTEEPHPIDLVVVTHAHLDHIGCLPSLVADERIRARWALVIDPRLGWGRTADNPPPDDTGSDANTRTAHRLAAALREETHDPRHDDDAIGALIDGAVSLESRYKKMIADLEAQKTEVVLFGKDDLGALTTAFATVGLEVLGPSLTQTLQSATLMAKAQQDLVAALTIKVDELRQSDPALSETDIYRQIIQSEDDAVDGSRSGNLINLQSVVLAFSVGGRKFLFTGDMQWAVPGTKDATVRGEIEKLKAVVAKRGPFHFHKLAHHGSDNGIDEELLASTGSHYLGICTGQKSAHHPNAATLELLREHQQADDLHWVRTDRNGRATIAFDGDDTPDVSVERGEANDLTPPGGDEKGPPAQRPPVQTPPVQLERVRPPERPARVMQSSPLQQKAAPRQDEVEVIARVPNRRTRVTITIDVQPDAADEDPPDARRQRISGGDGFAVAGGRLLPHLVFLTSRDALAANIGRTESDAVLAALRATGRTVIDSLPAGCDLATAVKQARRAMAAAKQLDGVVLVGGYDVVPSEVTDTLSHKLRQQLQVSSDADDFVVWSDDAYSDRDGTSMFGVPVSRVPDAKTHRLLQTALGAKRAKAASPEYGLRNVARPFADEVYRTIAKGKMQVSRPTVAKQIKPEKVLSDHVYMMLHGDHADSTRFWGETADGDMLEAFSIKNVPESSGTIAFTGCCWGALTVDQPAKMHEAGARVAPKGPASSIALRFLEAGALAFIGCTGTHYSPTEKPFDYFGGPMHSEFWSEIVRGTPPAAALSAAKRKYARAIPHRDAGTVAVAIEHKILRQYTCLGLGF